ncbi:MAG TPA: acetyl-CoA carboxylase biotin carboxyl carrier protein subunit, partial [Sphingomicrobium sp.]|nr:acetyl-CoA carboxylase biotin carboxyl carrier protein subunit [Sphingomicrobium sp.]
KRNLSSLVSRNEPSPKLASKAASVLPRMRQSGIPWDYRIGSGFDGFRLNADRNRMATVYIDDRPVAAEIVPDGDPIIDEIEDWSDDDHDLILFESGDPYRASLSFRGSAGGHGVHDGEIVAPMPGRVTAVEVSKGEKVAKGQRLLTLEAMKMEHALTAPFDGTVAELNAKPGAQVGEGQLLVKVEPDEKTGPDQVRDDEAGSLRAYDAG